MAEMYKELHGEGEYSFEQTENGVTGVRTFIRDDVAGGIGVADLPDIGDKMVDTADAEVDACLCRSRRWVYATGHGGSPVLQCNYSTNSLSGTGSTGNGVQKNPDARAYSMGVEQISIETGTSDGKLNRFEFVGAATGAEYVDQNITVNILAGTIDIPHSNQAMTEAEKNTFVALQAGYGKAINDAAFEGFAVGQVRYDGFSGGEFYNQDGELRFALELHFSTRLIGDNLANVAITSDDWLYVLNEKEGIFRKLKNHNTGKFLYEKKSFSALLASPP